jgi:hypothetical protein
VSVHPGEDQTPAEQAEAPQLSFMRPIEPRKDDDAPKEKLSRAERRAKQQARNSGKIQAPRFPNAAAPRNFTTRRSGG